MIDHRRSAGRSLNWSHRGTVVALTAVGWTLAGLLASALVSRIGWFGIILIGIAILFVASRWQIDEQNAIPSNPSGANHLYAAQYERQFARSPEERASRRAADAELNRALYVIRTIGLALLLLGVSMFIVHQLFP
jgi:MFS family permease